jgi:uncharacterized protein with HEPN domain
MGVEPIRQYRREILRPRPVAGCATCACLARLRAVTITRTATSISSSMSRLAEHRSMSYRVYLQHIRDALDDIATARAGRDAFFAERMRQDATIRKLQVIGEAVKSLSDTAKSHQPQIPWKQIAGLRNKVIHDYTA